MKKENFNIVELVNSSGCFDLQFRKDTRHERTGAPSYYRWKVQFVVTTPLPQAAVLKKVQNLLGAGIVTTAKNQARFSVQNISEAAEIIVPFFAKHTLAGIKKKDFQLWRHAVEIVFRNKGRALGAWKKNDLKQLIEIHKLTVKNKAAGKQGKWLDVANLIAKNPSLR